MIFTLETLAAKHGEALLLHDGDDDDPQLIVIDRGSWRCLQPNAQAATKRDQGNAS